jgi:hypothetical protein
MNSYRPLDNVYNVQLICGCECNLIFQLEQQICLFLVRSKSDRTSYSLGLNESYLRKFFERFRYTKVEIPSMLKGTSGIFHPFSFEISTRSGRRILGDLVSDKSPVDETKVLSLYIKMFDTGIKDVYLCVSPALTPNARKLAKLYNIKVIEAKSKDKLLKKFEESIRKIIYK